MMIEQYKIAEAHIAATIQGERIKMEKIADAEQVAKEESEKIAIKQKAQRLESE